MKEKIGIVVSKFNQEITFEMRDHALKKAKQLGMEVVKIVEVPGAFEIPFATKKLLNGKNIMAVVTLGAIIKGDTDHDQVIAHSIAKSLIDLSIAFHKPVSLGILGPNITLEQAKKRIIEYSERAVETIAEILRK